MVERGKGDRIFINTSGVGGIHPKAHIDASRVNVGDKIVLSGPIATHGIAIMSQREGLQFGTTLESDTCALNHAVMALLDEFGEEIKFFRDPTRGGVASSLNEVAQDQKIGIQLKDHKIPMLDEVRGGCELMGLDPLYVANEGVFVAIVSPEIEAKFTYMLQQMEGFERAYC